MPVTTSLAPRTGSRASRLRRGVAAVAALPVLLVGCSSNDTGDSQPAQPVTITDQWVKAADSGMSAAFGELHNAGDTPRTVVSASSPASGRVELHEVVVDVNGTKTMRPKQGGFLIPAHGTTQLRPGGEHIMFMGLNGPLRTGADTSVTLTFDDGSALTFTARVRDFSGNQENYAPGTGAQTPAHGG